MLGVLYGGRLSQGDGSLGVGIQISIFQLCAEIRVQRSVSRDHAFALKPLSTKRTQGFLEEVAESRAEKKKDRKLQMAMDVNLKRLLAGKTGSLKHRINNDPIR